MLMLAQFAVLLIAIFVGARFGGIAIGFAGGLGVIGLALLGASPAELPLDVVSIIMSVIAAIAAMQVAGGMEYLIYLATKILKKNPKYLNFLAPAVTYVMTLMAGTGHTAYSTMPVIVEVAKEADIPPSRPLSLGVVASQMAITASPISAAVVVFSTMLVEFNTGLEYVDLLMVAIPATLLSVMLTPLIMGATDKLRGAKPLSQMPIYQERLAEGLVLPPQPAEEKVISGGAKLSVGIFLIGLIFVTTYATLISDKLQVIKDPIMGRDGAIIATMLTVAMLIVIFCKPVVAEILEASTFKSGMSAAICVLGVAWMGMTFVEANMGTIAMLSSNILQATPWLLAIVLMLGAALLYSQAATTRALMPLALGVGVSGAAAIAAFPAVSALFILPTYPTLLAAVEMDDTGSTKIGKYIFNHPFMFPGLVMIGVAVAIGFGISAFL
ncbi:anaerobic C4-dicarboxylate transporter [Actinomyces minihominis]|uniref:anaerobic C4-dicarboxylate transporter n=1 Tax=Actinomyces minihominis TaxID=2002838 RepID=UPI000C06F529|nr:anaerobic C4-dicarboxylate transporter [Actinomyces minihominis]